MAVPFVAIRYTDPTSNVTTNITDWTLADNKRGLDLKAGVVTVRMNNSSWRNKYGDVSIFQENGLVEVYADTSPITYASSQLLLSGTLREIKPTIGENGSTYELVAADRTTLLLGGYWAKNFDVATPVHQIIQAIVSFSGNSKITTTNVATSGVAGSFVPKTYNPGMKPVVDMIQELSDPSFTGDDRTYMFYVDKDNDLHWFYPAQTASASILEGSTEFSSWTLSRDGDKVVNMVIYNAGNDLNGNGNLWYYWDNTSNSSTLRMKYYPLTSVTEGNQSYGTGMFDKSINAGDLVQSSTGTIPYKGKLYAVSPAYPFTPYFATSSVANITEYNSAWRTEQRRLADIEAAKITRRLGKLVWNGNLSIPGTNGYVAGNLLFCDSQTLGISNQLLRVVDVQQHIDENGWVTTLELKEDEAAQS